MDALRGIGAALVLTQHMPRPIQFAPSCIVVLDAFFLMSGVVLALVYLEKLQQGGRALRFCIERLVRFLPLHLAGVLLGGSFYVLYAMNNPDAGTSAGSAWTSLGLNLAFLPDVMGQTGEELLFPTNGPAWSLFAEYIVNVVFAATAVYLTRNRAIVVAVVTGGLLWHAVFNVHGSLNLGAEWNTMGAGVLRAGFAFYFGVLLAEWVPWMQRLRVPAMVPVALLFVPVLIPVPLTVALVVIMPATLLLSTASRPTGLLADICHWLGRLSFAVYALHWGVISWLKWGIHKASGVSLTALGGWGVLLVMVTTFALAYLVDRFFDVPLRTKMIKAVRQRLGKHRPAGSPPTSPPGDARRPA